MEEVKKTKRKIIEDLKKELEDVKSKLKSSESIKDMFNRESSEQKKIISEMHSVFDGIEGCQPRFVESKDQWGHCATIELSLQARLISFLQTLIK